MKNRLNRPRMLAAITWLLLALVLVGVVAGMVRSLSGADGTPVSRPAVTNRAPDQHTVPRAADRR